MVDDEPPFDDVHDMLERNPDYFTDIFVDEIVGEGEIHEGYDTLTVEEDHPKFGEVEVKWRVSEYEADVVNGPNVMYTFPALEISGFEHVVVDGEELRSEDLPDDVVHQIKKIGRTVCEMKNESRMEYYGSDQPRQDAMLENAGL